MKLTEQLTALGLAAMISLLAVSTPQTASAQLVISPDTPTEGEPYRPEEEYDEVRFVPTRKAETLIR